MAEERRLALERLRVICHSGLVSITDFRHNPLNIFAAHEMAAFADCSMATKMTVSVSGRGRVTDHARLEVPRHPHRRSHPA